MGVLVLLATFFLIFQGLSYDKNALVFSKGPFKRDDLLFVILLIAFLVIFGHFGPYLRAFWGLFFIFSRLLKQIQV